jgi:hypothetical protein
MKLGFALNAVTTAEFGVGRDDGNGQTFSLVPVNGEVQEALREMVDTTWQAMAATDDPPQYEPSEKYSAGEYVFLPLAHELAEQMRTLHLADNLPIDASALQNPGELFCYFARLTDKNQPRVTGLRRATQFKGILKNRLIRFLDDTLTLIEDQVFKLDTDFDLLVDSANIHILRPSGFEFAAKLQDAVMKAASDNIKVIQHDLKFVDFSGIEEYANKHPRAARYVASVRSQKETKNIDKTNLKKRCRENHVEIHEKNGKITVPDGHIMGFLEVLDRRRYQLELVKGSPERFRADSRRKL